MATSSSGAVFFLGTRAHYQVLQQPESHYDAENGNASTETIYQNPSVQPLWQDRDLDNESWDYCGSEVNVVEDRDGLELGTGVKRRSKRRSSETALCERDTEMKPALLNNLDCDTPKSKSRRPHLLAFLTSLARRKRRFHTEQVQYLQHLESALTSCTYRESCRCLDCQSRYFECDESEGYSSDESEYKPRYVAAVMEPQHESDDDEVFVDTVPGDNTSTDLLIEGREKMSVSSDEGPEGQEAALEIEVAAGTPVLLNYLLTHPITCSIQ